MLIATISSPRTLIDVVICALAATLLCLLSYLTMRADLVAVRGEACPRAGWSCGRSSPWSLLVVVIQ